MKYEFEQDRMLLKSVISRQAGDWRKGLLELVQNSIDACRQFDGGRITFAISNNGNTLTITDNGKGMSLSDIETYFRTFGLSSKGKEDIGEFGMGRGQVITMCYDPDADSMTGDVEVVTRTPTGICHRIHTIDITTLTFEVDLYPQSDYWHGTRWSLSKDGGEKWSYHDINHYLQSTVPFAPIDVFVENTDRDVRDHINKAILADSADIYVDNDSFTICVNEKYHGLKFYERGVFVTNVYRSGFAGVIVSKVAVKLNFARNEPIDTDPVWNSIMFTLDGELADHLEHRPTGEIGDDKAETIAILINNGHNELKSKKVFVDAMGKKHSIDELSVQGKVYVGGGLEHSSYQMSSGTIVLQTNFPLRRLLHKIDGLAVLEGDTLPTIKADTRPRISHTYRNAMDWLQELCPERPLKWGSKEGAKAFTDGHTIWFDYEYYRDTFALFNRSKLKFFCKVVKSLAHEISHTDSNIEDHHHDGYFWEEMVVNLQRLWILFMRRQYPNTQFDWSMR